jgi:site-specific recombinase XerD
MEFQTDIEDFTSDKKNINWVTPKEFEELRKGAKKTRYPIRNELIVLMLYRHGLRESELCNLKLEHLNFDEVKIFIKRSKGSISLMHNIEGDELRLIKRYLGTREGKTSLNIPFLFLSDRGSQFSRFSIIKIIEACYKNANLRKITPHMLRHGCGYYLANKGVDLRVIQDYLGHKNVNNTVKYTRLSGKQFKGLWD